MMHAPKIYACWSWVARLLAGVRSGFDIRFCLAHGLLLAP